MKGVKLKRTFKGVFKSILGRIFMRRSGLPPSGRRHSGPWHQRFTDWLETRWVNPDYKGWLLGGMALFFFLAASNTMAGWLYVMSGISVALLAIALYLTRRSLQGLRLARRPLAPVSLGQDLRLDLTLSNPTRQAKSLMQIQDLLPEALKGSEITAIALIPPHQDHTLSYHRRAQVRGVYRWDSVLLRSAAPLGLFWYRRSFPAQAKAVVYPQIFPLDRCPLIDALGSEQNPNLQKLQRSQAATEGLTRALRPYRWGDPIRMVHWRTSARYGELRVRELEMLQAGQEVVLAIDSGTDWGTIAPLEPAIAIPIGPGQINSFEQAVTALASLYRYASRYHERVRLWTAASGLVNGERRILETLAAVEPGEEIRAERPRQPIIWLTQNPDSLAQLPPGSRWLLWPLVNVTANVSPGIGPQLPTSGLTIDPTRSLQSQLQAAITR